MTVRLAQIGTGRVHAAGKTAVSRETAGAELMGTSWGFPRRTPTGAPPRVTYDHDLLVHEVLLRACGVAVEGQRREAPSVTGA